MNTQVDKSKKEELLEKIRLEKKKNNLLVPKETIEVVKYLSKCKKLDEKIEKNKKEISWVDRTTEDGTEYYRWSIFENPLKSELVPIPEPGPKMSLEDRKSYFQNENRVYSCKYLHPNQESAYSEYQIYLIICSTQRELKKDSEMYKFKYRTDEEMMESFHDCMKAEKTALPEFPYPD